jgi:hypothetical protein
MNVVRFNNASNASDLLHFSRAKIDAKRFSDFRVKDTVVSAGINKNLISQ